MVQHQFKVKRSEKGKTLQAFLYEKMGTWSHKKIKQAIDHKRVFVNGKNVFISRWNLKTGDRVLFTPQKTDYPQPEQLSRYPFVQVIYEDEDLLVTNKQAFVDFDSFVSHVNSYLRRTHSKKFYPYVGQMHRLDKETSGILIFTKKKRANVLAQQFRERLIKKYYLAIVHGRVAKEHDVIQQRLEKKKFKGGKKVIVSHDDQGKSSYTEYWVEERYEDATLLRVLLGTGRTHQIRVHLSEIGYPLLGDKLYGQSSTPLQNIPGACPNLSIKRQALHAHQVEFWHPITNKKLKFIAPLPQDMAHFIDQLRLGGRVSSV